MQPPDLPDWLARFESGHYRPATFLERGVSLPFTTPCLLGGRIRPAERRSAELVLANPSGIEGAYILPWSSLPELCAPTLHDRALWSRVAELAPLTPQTVREAARAVAAEGYAGRAAAQAAAAAEASRCEAGTILHYLLLLELVRQVEPRRPGVPPPERDSPAEVTRRALAALRRQHFAAPATALEMLGEIGEAFEGCGLRGGAGQARLPRLAAEIEALAASSESWAAGQGEAVRAGARLLAASAELTLQCCRRAFADVHALLGDLLALLNCWRLEQGMIHTLLARPEWLLDGWELICGLWRDTQPERRAVALIDMAMLVPVIPAEVRNWMGFDAAGAMDGHRAGLRRWRRTVQVNEDWLSGRLLQLIARNERLRAFRP